MGKIVGKIFAQPAEEKAETTPQLFRCELCGKEYKTEKGLADHMKKEHPLDIVPGENHEEDPAGNKTKE